MRRNARPVNHFRMVIFDSPREAAVAAHPNPVLLRGNGERFTGYGVAGPPCGVNLWSAESAARRLRLGDRWLPQRGLSRSELRIRERPPNRDTRSGRPPLRNQLGNN
jgi:hypothetical protein